MSGAIPPLLHITVWRDQINFILYFLKMFAKAMFVPAEGIEKLHDSIRIQICRTVRKTVAICFSTVVLGFLILYKPRKWG
jgi:hypothetical protein